MVHLLSDAIPNGNSYRQKHVCVGKEPRNKNTKDRIKQHDRCNLLNKLKDINHLFCISLFCVSFRSMHFREEFCGEDKENVFF